MNDPRHFLTFVYMGYHLDRLYYPSSRQHKDVIQDVQNLSHLIKYAGFSFIGDELDAFLTTLRGIQAKP